MSIISIRNVSKTYGENKETKVEALKSTSFDIEKNEFVCVIGTSGSGKSTLLHLLAGVDNVTTGEILINNKDITKLSNDDLALFRRKEIGIIYQFFNLVPVLTARKNIELPLRLDQKPIDQEYFNELISLLKIENRIDFLPNKLSGGEQQRVAIARALIHKPSILLADEPTGNLNSMLAKDIMNFFSLASKRFNQTILMITHDLHLASYADRIIEIQDGQIVKSYKTSDFDQIEESSYEPYDKETIIKRTEERIHSINQIFENNQVVDTDIEGIDNVTGDYVLNLERMYQIFTTFHNLEMKASFVKETVELTEEVLAYFEHFKKAIQVYPDHMIVLKNFRKNKIKKRFKNKKSFLTFIDGFDMTGYLSATYKEELIKQLKTVE